MNLTREKFEAVEKCRKKRGKKQRDSDVGGEAMACRRAQRTAAANGTPDNSSPAYAPAASNRKQEDFSMIIDQVEHYDIFEDDVIIFWLDISDVPQTLQTEARQIDGEHFEPNCFGICANYSFQERQFCIVIDTEASTVRPSNIFYIDRDGDKHWFTTELSQAFIEQVFLMCVSAVDDEDLEIKPTEQEAYQSAAREMEKAAL